MTLSRRHSAKVFSTIHVVRNSMVAVVKDLCPIIQIGSEVLPEIHTVEKCAFLKPIIHSQTF